MDFDEFSEVTRQLIRHEDQLRDQRLGWLVTAQGVLFAALALIWDKTWVVSAAISVAGAISCVSIAGSLRANTEAIRQVVDEWEEKKPEEYDGPRVIGLRSAQNPTRWARVVYPWAILPWILLLSWLVILGFRLT